MLFNKKREELLIMDGMRISYSYDDVLVEDFYMDKGHPYAVYDLFGNLLETNMLASEFPNALSIMYQENIYAIRVLIQKFGVDI